MDPDSFSLLEIRSNEQELENIYVRVKRYYKSVVPIAHGGSLRSEDLDPFFVDSNERFMLNPVAFSPNYYSQHARYLHPAVLKFKQEEDSKIITPVLIEDLIANNQIIRADHLSMHLNWMKNDYYPSLDEKTRKESLNKYIALFEKALKHVEMEPLEYGYYIDKSWIYDQYMEKRYEQTVKIKKTIEWSKKIIEKMKQTNS